MGLSVAFGIDRVTSIDKTLTILHTLHTEGIDVAAAAGLPVAFGTAHLALAERAKLQGGQVLLVLGAGGGVGVAAVQVSIPHLGIRLKSWSLPSPASRLSAVCPPGRTASICLYPAQVFSSYMCIGW